MASSLGHVAGPRWVVESAPAQLASTRASSMGRPWKMPAQRTPECASPAPLVSMAWTCGVGMYWLCIASLGWQYQAPRAPALRTTGLSSLNESERQRDSNSVTSPVSGWHPRRFARIGPSRSFSDQKGIPAQADDIAGNQVHAFVGALRFTGQCAPCRCKGAFA